ncbi:MAG TPA: aminotransferase class IV [Saprospiraceae bacterium]|nr:aminotransferase class IV [Saprospiraceae bacterium]
MCQLLESIRIENGKVRLMDWHNARAERSMADLFGIRQKMDMRKYIVLDQDHKQDIHKCRIVYGKHGVEKVEISTYPPRIIQKIKIVEGGNISYPYKTLERPALDRLYGQRGQHDEICILNSEGFVTDAYYFNFVFEVGGSYFTPSHALLPGVMKAYLEFHNRITQTAIHVDDIHKFERVHLINAMNPLGKISLFSANLTRE